MEAKVPVPEQLLYPRDNRLSVPSVIMIPNLIRRSSRVQRLQYQREGFTVCERQSPCRAGGRTVQ